MNNNTLNQGLIEMWKVFLNVPTKYRQNGVLLQDLSWRQIANLCNLSQIVGKAKKWWFEGKVFDLEANMEVNIEYHLAEYWIIFSKYFWDINVTSQCRSWTPRLKNPNLYYSKPENFFNMVPSTEETSFMTTHLLWSIFLYRMHIAI